MSSPSLTIRSLSARAVNPPLPRPMRTAAGTLPSAPLVLIDIASEEGPAGRAYIFAYAVAVLKPLVELFAPLGEMLAGRPAAPADRMRDMAARFRLLGRQGLLGMALSGIEMALWDMQGRAAGAPLARLLGVEPAPVCAYDSFGLFDPAADRAAIEASLAAGFTAIKIKIGDSEAADLAALRELRAMTGDKIEIMVDYNQTLTVQEARRRIARIAPFGVTWVEEPVAAEDFSGHAAVRAGSPAPIQTGENWWFPADAAKAMAAGACDFAMLDVMKIGGVSGWMEAAAIAGAASVPASSHLFIEASAHLLAATRNAHFLEYLDIAAAILEEPLRPVAGAVAARGPGLGLAWDEARVRRHLV